MDIQVIQRKLGIYIVNDDKEGEVSVLYTSQLQEIMATPLKKSSPEDIPVGTILRVLSADISTVAKCITAFRPLNKDVSHEQVTEFFRLLANLLETSPKVERIKPESSEEETEFQLSDTIVNLPPSMAKLYFKLVLRKAG